MATDGLIEMNSNASSKLIDVPEAAALLDVSPNTLRQWLSQGRLPLIKVGRLTKLRPQDVQAFIARHERPARPVAEAAHTRPAERDGEPSR